MAIVEARELYRFYHSGDTEVVALRGVNLSLNAGEIVALVGPSGSGKSTLLHLLAGLDEPDGGQVDIAGHRLSRRPETIRSALRAQFIGVFMQSGNLIDHLTVGVNIALQRRLAGKQNLDTKVRRFANPIDLMAHWNAFPYQLSGGEAARAGLAVAMAADPPILLCDEPTAEVDAENEQLIISDLTDRRRSGVAILIATHSKLVARSADRVVRLLDGKAVND